jgi:hypothetical protein
MSDSFQAYTVRTPFRLKKVLLNSPNLSQSSFQGVSFKSHLSLHATRFHSYLLQIQRGSSSRQRSPNASNDQKQKRRSRATSPFLSPDRYRTDHHRLSPSFLGAAATLPPPPKLQQSASLTSRTYKFDNLHKSQENSSGDRADPVPRTATTYIHLTTAHLRLYTLAQDLERSKPRNAHIASGRSELDDQSGRSFHLSTPSVLGTGTGDHRRF